jgi:hypothetical protein
MKRKELYDYIREEIINELKEAELDIPTPSGTSDTATSDQKTQAQKASAAGTTVKYIKKGQIKEDDLEELASYKFFRVSDRAKFDALKDIYVGTVEARILDAIEAAGEQGITQANLASTLGIVSAVINPILKKFGSVNAITLPVSEKPGKATTAPAEEPEVEEPETEEPTSTEKPESEFFMGDDTENKEDEEDKAMEPIDEPSAADIAAVEKELGSADTEKIVAANKAAGIVKNLTAKIEGMKKGPEREKKLAALKQYIKNNRSTVLKGFKISNLTNGLVS